MSAPDSGCLLCGADLVYGASTPRACGLCGAEHAAEVACAAGHFVCDACHALPAVELIERTCRESDARDPLRLAAALMRHPAIRMHGPEHHFLVPAVLLTALCNTQGRSDKAALLATARQRAADVKGGFCGHHGACGAGVGVGIFVSVALGATPLTTQSWQLANRATAEALLRIAELGGPRCCKRDTFAAIQAAAAFARQHLGIELPVEGEVRCDFHAGNRECLQGECPYFFEE